MVADEKQTYHADRAASWEERCRETERGDGWGEGMRDKKRKRKKRERRGSTF